jgi:hypothetical protein
VLRLQKTYGKLSKRRYIGMRKKKHDKREQKDTVKKVYEKPALIAKVRVSVNPSAWGSYQP